jgi:hypothetical protein
MGWGEAQTTDASYFAAVPEYSELPSAPIEKVSTVCGGFTTESIPGVRPEVAGQLTCHGTEMSRSSNPGKSSAG